MYCPNCNMPRPNDPYFCAECGSRLIAPPTRKKGKLWPPIVFMVVMLTIGFTLFFLSDRKEQPKPSTTPWFTVTNGALSFHSDKYTGGGSLTIPSSVDGQTITALADGCFQNCDILVEVTLPDTLRIIGKQSFRGCDNLRGIKLTEQVRSIGDQAFAQCSSLEAIYVPESVQLIGEDAFTGCEALKHIFFVGDFFQWHGLYAQKINSFTEIYTVDGPDADSYEPA